MICKAFFCIDEFSISIKSIMATSQLYVFSVKLTKMCCHVTNVITFG